MCMTCGCENTTETSIPIAKPGKINSDNLSLIPEQGHEHHHDHSDAKTVVEREQDTLQSNNFRATNLYKLIP